MPVVAREGKYTIRIHTRDEHPPPHVHVYYDDTVVRIKLEDLSVLDKIKKNPPRELFEVVRKHRLKALSIWEHYIARE